MNPHCFNDMGNGIIYTPEEMERNVFNREERKTERVDDFEDLRCVLLRIYSGRGENFGSGAKIKRRYRWSLISLMWGYAAKWKRSLIKSAMEKAAT
ncbi:hypothetical protein GCM10025859_54980 [Alicyclobacillus fastidiosus]|nr:hypothetical protein GCM10025859_54980 [Alicyclobacillus fastidiosus]